LLDLFLLFQLSLLLVASAASLFHFTRHLGNTVMVDGGAKMVVCVGRLGSKSGEG
jgi:hypothetical protein